MAYQLFRLPKATNIGTASFRLEAGAKAYFYATGTATPQNTYQDSTLLTPHANPVVADSAGVLAAIYLNASLDYKLTLTRSDGSLIYTVDPVNDTNLQIELDAMQVEIDANTTNIATNTTSITALRAVDNDLIEQAALSLAASTAVTVACFGDSTMWGADPASLAVQVATPPPTQLQNFINNFFGNSSLTVTNNAISGTTATQMIAGTDGSGSTFAAKMAVSGASVVYCNHGVNDAFGPNATTALQYKTALLAFVSAVRLVSKTPVLVTPFATLTIGTFGSQARSEATAYFAQIMRDVAAVHGVALVDNNNYQKLYLGIDGIMPLVVLPDGVHGSQATYSRAGNNLAEAILGGQANTLSVPGQRAPASGPSTRATSQAISQNASSRAGATVTSGTSSPQTLRMIFKVSQPGMDLYFAHPIWSNGSATISLAIDGISTYTFNQRIAGFSSTFVHDLETLIARNIEPGFHIIIMTTSSVGAAGVNYLRTRAVDKPALLPSANSLHSQRVMLSPLMTSESTAAGTQFVSDTMPVSRLIDGYEIEFTGTLQKNSGVIVGGNIGDNSTLTGVEKLVIFGLNGSGFLAVSEASAPATFTTTAIGGTDLSVASHVYRVAVTTAGVASLYVDGTLIGTNNLAQPYYGGYLGLWKNSAGGTLTITDLCRVWRL
jgi:lysophospholipase L1-like esterase